MNSHSEHWLLERQLLLQLGDRLKQIRLAQHRSAVSTAQAAGISRTTLASVESGDPGPSLGTYLRVMSVLGVAGDLALLAGDSLRAASAGTAGARSTRQKPMVRVEVSAEASRHQVQDLQSLALHEAAVRLVRSDPAFLDRATETLQRWLDSGSTRSDALWREWQDVLRSGQWRRVLARTRRAQELRQASPLTAVLPAAAREEVLQQLRALKLGVALGADEGASP